MLYRTRVLGGLALASTVLPLPALAEVSGLDILSRAPAYDGRVFGDVGAYERIDAIAHFTLDPKSERGAKIVDLDKAPVNADGLVEFSSTVTILAPVDADKGAKTIFYEVANRGRNLSFGLLNSVQKIGKDFTIDDPGDGFLMQQGFTVVWSGWQAGLPENLAHMSAPVISDFTAPSREEYIFDKDEAVSTGKLSYPAADLDPAKATLTVRAKAGDERTTPEGLTFRYVDENTIEITRPAGYDAGAIYEFIYPAKGSLPNGLGFVAVADLVSFLRGNGPEGIEVPVGPIEHTIDMGISQSGRFSRDFVYQGFNADANGKPVFDGVMAHIAGARKTFVNYSFAQPGRYSRQHEDHDMPGDQFPFTYVDMIDPVSGQTGSILTACSETNTCPKVIQSDTSTEFWQARGSLVSTAPDGTALTMPENVRLFLISGAPHFSVWGAASKEAATCAYPTNPLSAEPTMRALTVAMKDWVLEGKEPPASVYPAGRDQLVAADAAEMPMINGTRPQPPVNGLEVRDYSVQPPKAGGAYEVLVPKVDADGMPIGGVHELPMAVPLGSYLGWNLRKEGFAGGELCGTTGSYLAFPETGSNADSRAPVSARYADAAAYHAQLKEAADALIAQGLLLEADREMVISAAPAYPGN
ncbi:hypothetical protein SAMN05877809_102513 [Rhodobacter sp. JA431]|uniref:alpha/beta hydrolase domain-containing protein n=1 Tax=Rhodobacter sp. JA431 TaxID=570013 RepID=UPI000BD11DE0|nr:alpha/beta hydrolase domain-containing protein [Rhodobacter sp. JA431]SOB99832.1 hypothetical protein SAMN05877809_102513 [Rhodobacter sp. JA431]